MKTVGILGVGGMGRTHARHYRSIGNVELLAFDIDSQRLAEFAQEFDARAVESADSLISRADIVDICVPTPFHFEYAKLSLYSGRPVLCEKPMCRDVAQCAELAELSKKTGVPLMPAQVVRFFPAFRRAHELVEAGWIGTPAAVRTRRGGEAPKGAGNWFLDPAQSGGVIMDLMIHDFDWIRWTFGEVESVFAQSLTFSGTRGLDYALATLKLESGVVAHVEGTWADPGGFRVSFEVVGSGGLIEHDSRATPSLRTATKENSVAESPFLPSDDPYFSQLRAFLNSLESNSPPPVGPEEGLKAVAIAEAAINSVRSGKPQKPAKA